MDEPTLAMLFSAVFGFYRSAAAAPSPAPGPPPPPPPGELPALSVTFPLSGSAGYVIESATSIYRIDGGTSNNFTFGPITATVSNGTGPYVYSWSFTTLANSGTASASMLDAVTSASMRWSCSAFQSGPPYFGAQIQILATCNVIDSLGSTGSASLQITYNLTPFDSP